MGFEKLIEFGEQNGLSSGSEVFHADETNGKWVSALEIEALSSLVREEGESVVIITAPGHRRRRNRSKLVAARFARSARTTISIGLSLFPVVGIFLYLQQLKEQPQSLAKFEPQVTVDAQADKLNNTSDETHALPDELSKDPTDPIVELREFDPFSPILESPNRPKTPKRVSRQIEDLDRFNSTYRFELDFSYPAGRVVLCEKASGKLNYRVSIRAGNNLVRSSASSGNLSEGDWFEYRFPDAGNLRIQLRVSRSEGRDELIYQYLSTDGGPFSNEQMRSVIGMQQDAVDFQFAKLERV